MNLSEEPARKVFVKQCINLVLDKTPVNQIHRKWSLVEKNKSIHVGLVWIQGFIINVSELLDTICLDDGSGEVVLMSVKDAIGFGPWIQKGQYVMVIGEVFSISPDIKIKARRLTHIVEPNSEILWILEVLDFWNFLEST